MSRCREATATVTANRVLNLNAIWFHPLSPCPASGASAPVLHAVEELGLRASGGINLSAAIGAVDQPTAETVLALALPPKRMLYRHRPEGASSRSFASRM